MAHDSSRLRSNCPINYLLETVGDKWTLLVIRDLMFKGKKHYGEFLASDEGISTNILADRLRRLETCGVVERQPDAANRARVVYRLTEKGRDLLPLMLEITAWSARYDAKTNTPPALVRALERDRRPIVDKILRDLDAADERE